MFKHYFELIHNIEVYPLISMFIFLSFFVGLLLYVFTLKKQQIERISHLPLEEDTQYSSSQEQPNK